VILPESRSWREELLRAGVLGEETDRNSELQMLGEPAWMMYEHPNSSNVRPAPGTKESFFSQIWASQRG